MAVAAVPKVGLVGPGQRRQRPPGGPWTRHRPHTCDTNWAVGAPCLPHCATTGRDSRWGGLGAQIHSWPQDIHVSIRKLRAWERGVVRHKGVKVRPEYTTGEISAPFKSGQVKSGLCYEMYRRQF